MTLVCSFRRVLLSTCLMGALLPVAAQAQQRIQIGDLVQRIDRLESEVTRLRVAPRSGGGADVARLDQIEQELRRLTGMIERMDFERRQAETKAEKRLDGFEERLGAMEALRKRESVALADRPAFTPSDPEPQTLYQPSAGLTVPTVPFHSTPPGLQGGSEAIPRTLARPSQTPDVLYDEGLRLLNIGSFDQAGAQFEDLIATHPQDPRAGQAQFWLGDMHFKLGRYEQAASAFLDSFRNWPEGPKAPDSLLKLGMTLANIGKTEEACLSFKQVPARYPSAPPSLLRRAQIEEQRYRCGS